MLKILIFLIAVALFKSATASNQNAHGAKSKHEVADTFNTPINTFEYQLSLYVGDEFICGATMIDSEWAITTAHCTQVKKKTDLNLRAGISIGEGPGLPIITIVTHPNFDEHTLDFDYALLQVKWPFKTINKVIAPPVALPKMHDNVHPNMPANVTGWGTTKDGDERPSKHLKFATVTIYSNKQCKKHHKGLTKHMICAGDSENPESSCQGDTGGPLVSRGKLVGMVSWGQNCLVSDNSVVYAAIHPIRKWIRKHLNTYQEIMP